MSLKKIWKTPQGKIISIFLSLGILIIFSYTSVEITSTPAFCGICHEIQPAIQSWKESSHYANGEIRANCRDCHVPPWENPIAVFYSKITHGTKDIYHHFKTDKNILNSRHYQTRMMKNALKQISNETCLYCHKSILEVPSPTSIKLNGAMIQTLHANAESQKISCMTCHQNVSHRRK